MNAAVYETPNEKAISGALTLAMHALFFALLVFGVSWQKRQADTMVAELWSSLPQPAPKAEPAPPPKVEPEPPKPALKVEPRPVPKAEPTPKADIELREKKDKERKAQEQQLAEKKKREQEEALKRITAEQAKEAEAKRLAQEQADAQKKLAAQAAAARAAEIEKYKRQITDRIMRFYVDVPFQGNPEVEMEVVVFPGGEVASVKTKRGSGQPAWDNMVERAIIRAGGGPGLPVPKDPELFREFRELNLKLRPKP